MSIVKGIALITGSAQGIGRSIALRLARDGFDIALNDVSSKRDQLCAVADEIDKIGRRTLLVPADVTVEEEVKGMVQDVSEHLGGLDVMVANAGVAKLSSLVSTRLEDWDRIMAVNARGPFLCYKYAAQQMIKQGRGGRIIGASSVLGRSALPLCAPYAASKFAIRGLTQSAALELGKYKITVNAYAPGIIKTPMVETLPAVAEADMEMFNITMGRLSMKAIEAESQPEDIASIVSYLVSKEAHFITGQCITVDGGIVPS
ncbi:hypothetical protein EV363DRAFT_1329072 [Boletus edulis]|uniref:Short chain oxidoreductase n=1 Tax=Boletus edulis BED1 TaxID=1328754 RepID=A0AAD4BZ83_BOLED|nr:hypothetical protein EV363DRAFT_1329072 [Boletus edulis]KAF8444084.1 short chain oxidoreductase [Boletus edulis BED1]